MFSVGGLSGSTLMIMMGDLDGDELTLRVSEQDTSGGDDYAKSVVTSQSHLIKDYPLLKEMEEMGSKDEEYFKILHAIRTGSSNTTLPSSSEGKKMGGEWNRLHIMYLVGNDGISRIYLPKPYREKILEVLHKGVQYMKLT